MNGRAVLHQPMVENHLLILIIGRDLDRINKAVTHDVGGNRRPERRNTFGRYDLAVAIECSGVALRLR